MNYRDYFPAIGHVVRSVAARLDGEFYYGDRNDDAYEVRCARGARYGLALIKPRDLMMIGRDDGAFVDLVRDACRYAWLLAGGGDLNIPFRIGVRSPKRLQIAKRAA